MPNLQPNLTNLLNNRLINLLKLLQDGWKQVISFIDMLGMTQKLGGVPYLTKIIKLLKQGNFI